MPFYEYLCTKCNKRFELLQKMEEHGLAACPECGSGEIQKLLSLFGVAAGPSAEDAPGCGPENCRCSLSRATRSERSRGKSRGRFEN